jgi:hypothetical protein
MKTCLSTERTCTLSHRDHAGQLEQEHEGIELADDEAAWEEATGLW